MMTKRRASDYASDGTETDFAMQEPQTDYDAQAAAEEKAQLEDLTAWVAKAMIASHQGDNPLSHDKIDPASSLTAAREFVAAFRAMHSFRPKDPPAQTE